MRKLLFALVGLVLIIGVTFIPTPASSDPGPGTVYSPQAAITCAGTREPELDEDYHFGSAQPVYMDVNHVRYSCTMHAHDNNTVCHGIAIYWSGGAITGWYTLSCGFIL